MDIENDIPSGWKDIFEPIKKYIKRHNLLWPFKKIKINQIRINNGLLEFDITNSNITLSKLLNEAKDKSANTCMNCGSTKNVGVTQDGSNSVLCYDCVLEKANQNKDNISWFSNDESEEMIIPYVTEYSESL
jgi:hypothetical protein